MSSRITLLSLIAFFLLVAAVHGQNRQSTWSFRPTGASAFEVEPRNVKSDANGNVYVAGSFSNEFDADPGPGVHMVQGGSGGDAFILKFSASQQLLWAAVISGNGAIDLTGIGVDGNGNVVVGGWANDSVDLDPGPGRQMTIGGSGDDLLLLSLDANGNFRWGQMMGGTGYDEIFAIAVDAAGNTYATGGFAGTVDFNPGGTPSISIANGPADAFVAKYDSQGQLVWNSHLAGPGGQAGLGIALDGNGNVIHSGTFTGTVDFDPSPIASHSIAASQGPQTGDIYLSKLDNSGAFVWAIALGDSDSLLSDAGGKVMVDANNDIYVEGDFDGSIDFDPSVNGVHVLAPATGVASFVLKVDASGNFQDAFFIETSHTASISDICLSNAGELSIAGMFITDMDLDPGSGTIPVQASGSLDGFVIRLNSSGDFIGGYPLHGGYVSLFSISPMASGGLYVAGGFTDLIQFDPSSPTDTLQSPSLRAGFVLLGLDVAVSTPERGASSVLQIFPNPSSSRLQVRVPELLGGRSLTLRILNDLGQLEQEFMVSGERVDVDVTHLPKGIHHIELKGNKASWSGTFVKL